jgi:replicative DNA helicase
MAEFNNNRKNEIVRRAGTDPENKARLIGILLQNPEAFEAVIDQLTPEMFAPYDLGYGLLWKTALDFFEENNELPDYTLLQAELQTRIAEDPEYLTDEEIEELSEFLDDAFGGELFKKEATCKSYTKWAIKTAKSFMKEQIARKAKELIHTNNTVPVDLPSLLHEIHTQVEAVESVGENTVQVAFESGWEQRAPLQLMTTGISFFDRFTGGGHTGGEVYGVLGPYGSCKTTLAVMLLVEAAKSFNALSAEDGDDVPLAFIASYEARKAELQLRSLGFAARVLRASLEEMKNFNDLSTSSDLRDYEKRLFKRRLQLGKRVMGELERVNKTLHWMNKHIIFLDMTGADEDNRTAGGGGIKEISRRITSTLRSRPGTRCGAVVIDYVGAMVRRYMDANDVDQNQLRHLITGTPLAAKSSIGDQHDCPIWLLHQLSGDANSLSETAKVHHTNAAESKSFGENLDFAMCLGVPNIENLCTLTCTKRRRQPPQDSTIVKIDGAFNRVLDMDGKYVLDTSARKIMSVADRDRLPGLEAFEGVPAAAGNSESDISVD